MKDMHPRTGVTARFLLRSVGLPQQTRIRLDGEQQQYGDMLMLPVHAKHHRLRGRILSLHAWLHLAFIVCPACKWICKADDDSAVLTPDLQRIVGMLDQRLGSTRNVVAGHLAWHTWNTAHFMHHTLFLSYDKRSQREAHRAIDHFANADTPPRPDAKLRRALQRCNPGGPLTGCGWCPISADCSGPFPFAVGWLIILNAHLASELRRSARVKAEMSRLKAVNRTWGPPAMEDIWLGSLLHETYCTGNARSKQRGRRPDSESDLTFVSLSPAHAFNGGWHTGRGLEYNTTWLYHNKHELPLIAAHANQVHSSARPELQCAGDRPLRRRRGSADGNRLGTQTSSYPYATALERSHRHYMRDAGCGAAGSLRWCSLIEPQFLKGPEHRWHAVGARINQVARPLSPSEEAQVSLYHTEVRAARLAFRKELEGAGLLDSELRLSDYLDV